MLDFLLEKYNELTSGGVNSSIIAVIAVLAVIGFIKGAVKMVFFLCTIAGAFVAAYWGSENGVLFVQQYWKGMPDVAPNVMGGVCGVVAFYTLYKIFDFIKNPFEENELVGKFGFGLPGALFSTLVAAAIVWFGVNKLKDEGARDEMKYWMSQRTGEPLKNYPILARLKHKFETSSLGQKISNVYRLEEDEHHNLAKLAVIAKTSQEKINSLYKNPKVQNLLNNPKVREFMQNSPELRRAIEESNPNIVLESPQLIELLRDPQVLESAAALTSSELK